MRVLHFFKTYYPDTFGGVEQVIFQICQGSQARGIDSEVLTLTRTGGSDTVPVGNHRAHRAPLNLELASTGFSYSVLRRFARLAAEADIVHYHFPWPYMDLAHFLVRHGKPSVVSYHSDVVRQKRLLRLYRPLMHRFLRSVDHIVATSPNYLATSETLLHHRNKVSAIPIGLDEGSYPSAQPERIAHWRRQVGEGFFLFVGMLRYYKGLQFLLEAAAGTDLPVVILGAGPEEAALKAQARRLRLANVHFLGALPDADKVALLTLCGAVVCPSHLRAEAFGVTLLEGAMSAKPLICCEIGTGTTYINLHEQTGLVVPPADAAALREAMLRLRAQPELARRLGLAARSRFEALFTAERMLAGYHALYQTLLTRRPTAV